MGAGPPLLGRTRAARGVAWDGGRGGGRVGRSGSGSGSGCQGGRPGWVAVTFFHFRWPPFAGATGGPKAPAHPSGVGATGPPRFGAVGPPCFRPTFRVRQSRLCKAA